MWWAGVNIEFRNTLQDRKVLSEAKTATSFWGWFPVMVYRMRIPAGEGVLLKLERDPRHLGTAGDLNPG